MNVCVCVCVYVCVRVCVCCVCVCVYVSLISQKYLRHLVIQRLRHSVKGQPVKNNRLNAFGIAGYSYFDRRTNGRPLLPPHKVSHTYTHTHIGTNKRCPCLELDQMTVRMTGLKTYFSNPLKIPDSSFICQPLSVYTHTHTHTHTQQQQQQQQQHTHTHTHTQQQQQQHTHTHIHTTLSTHRAHNNNNNNNTHSHNVCNNTQTVAYSFRLVAFGDYLF